MNILRRILSTSAISAFAITSVFASGSLPAEQGATGLGPSTDRDRGAPLVVDPNELRKYKAGNFWEYTWNASYDFENYSGTAKIELKSGQYGGRSALVAKLTGTARRYGTLSMQAFVRQRSDRTLDLLAFTTPDSSRPRIPTPSFNLPGHWYAGMEFDYHLAFEDTDIEFRMTVLNTETVTTPAGTFRAWKVSNTADQNVNPRITIWFSPAVGSFIKAEGSFMGGTATMQLKRYK